MVELRRNASMHCKKFRIYHSTNRHSLKQIHNRLIDLAIIFLLAYIKFILHYNLKVKNVVMVRL